MTATTDQLGRQQTFAYDALNRLTTETWYNAGGSVAQIFTSTYDAVGDLLTGQNAQGTYTMSYDALGRVTVVNELFSQTLTFSYDAAGNRTSVQDSQGGLQTSLYDADNRLQQLSFSGVSTTQLRINETYQANGELSTLTRYNALGGPSTPIGVTTYLYDASNRVTSITDSNGSATVLASYVYNYDAGSRVTSEVDNGVTRSYSYDADNQLTADGTNTYTYDATGNRNNASWSAPTGDENELQTDGTWTYSYDAAGNLIKKTKGLSAETWTYSYDNLNRMTVAKQYTEDPSNGGTLEQEDDYYYDYFGNRDEKDVTVSGVTTTQRYDYDGWNPAKKGSTGNSGWDVWADLDGSNNLQTRYLRGDVVDQLFARVASGGTGAWLLTDHLGSIVGVTDNSGVLQDTIAYDGWGNITSETNSAWGGRYKWTGREADTETGLQYNRARYYDPATGRWTSQDPTGFEAGDSNLYRYVSNIPNGNTDPSGTEVHVFAFEGWGGYNPGPRNPGQDLKGEPVKIPLLTGGYVTFGSTSFVRNDWEDLVKNSITNVHWHYYSKDDAIAALRDMSKVAQPKKINGNCFEYNRIIVLGFSAGGDAVYDLVNSLTKKDGILIDMVFTADPVPLNVFDYPARAFSGTANDQFFTKWRNFWQHVDTRTLRSLYGFRHGIWGDPVPGATENKELLKKDFDLTTRRATYSYWESAHLYMTGNPIVLRALKADLAPFDNQQTVIESKPRF